MSGPPRKRPRHEEPPIFARKASRSTPNSPVMANRRNPPSQAVQQQDQSQPQQPQQQHQSPSTIQSQQVSLQLHSNQKGPGTPIQRQNTSPTLNIPVTPTCFRSPYSNEHPTLGSWEPSIDNTIPYDEITRRVADFLFDYVVKYEDPNLNWNGAGGPILEIEAKLGQIVSKLTGSRLYLPVQTETVLVDDMDHAFRSTMTEVGNMDYIH